MTDDGYEWVVNHAFGHPVYYDGKGVERYCDTHERTTWPSQRPCPKCGQLPTPEGDDPCIASLPGVEWACCGHGFNGYVMFEDGRTIRFPRAKVFDDRPLRDAWRRIIAALKGRAGG